MSTLGSRLIGTVVPAAMFLAFSEGTFGQVIQCTDGGCEPFALECYMSNKVPVCLNSHYDELGNDPPSRKDEHLCDIALSIMEKNCQKENPQPCLVAEDRVLDRCFFVPTTACVEPQQAADFFNNYPDTCFGTCTDPTACN